ncbi:Large terminase phage packaging protein [Sphingomonas guangdongensis]|uniref:Large terminase phage packaging protein n=1 Tax=Sphingomonas guangdongensis TaxID=1141890 RepID=A0A285QH69_9SPHN|nr:terminase family protein [Sphingomonas guangdongensis]SOB81186.1 Large terminase phage packaging protein [Sphingomonas guangdongensis]
MSTDVRALLARLAILPADEIGVLLRKLSPVERRALNDAWHLWAHAGQVAPPGDWRVWLIRAGRGFGKTRAGAEWLSACARTMPQARIALIGSSGDEARRVMVEGASGLLAVARDGEAIDWAPASGRLTFASGAQAWVYSAEASESLRGPEHHLAWCDELAKWRRGDAAWDNLLMGLRLGERPRVLVTTTPRPTALMRRVLALPDLVETRGATRDNPHLPQSFVAAMAAQYGGTRLGRQELDGELIDDVEGALWTRATVEGCRVAVAPALTRVVVGVDPPASASGDACGIVVAGLGADGDAYVLEDASVAGQSPEGWARTVAAAAARHGADRVVAEANQGGDMVRSVLQAADTALPVRLVHASRGKVARAEPVAAFYERGRVRHVGAWPALEEELCGLMVGGGYGGPGRSPDRADALVWAVTALLVGRRGTVGVRAV